MDIGSLVGIIVFSLFVAWLIGVPACALYWYRRQASVYCPICHDIVYPRWFERHVCDEVAVGYYRRVAIARQMGIKPEQVSPKLLDVRLPDVRQ